MMRRYLLTFALLFAAGCSSDWENPTAPPDGGPAAAPIGYEIMCQEHPDSEFCNADD